MMDLSVITVTHHSKDYIEDLIFSTMMSCFKIRFEHIVVDNASQDETADFIKQRFSDHVTLIQNYENKGFSYANNQALKIAKGRYILFLNPDLCIREGELDSAIDLMDEKQDIGLLTCKLLDPMGQVSDEGHPADFPKLKEALRWIFNRSDPDVLNKKRETARATEACEIDNVRGSFLLVRREILEKLGWGFDPRYFLLFEDTDLCREVKKLGYRTVYYPYIACIDYMSRSFSIKNPQWVYKQYTTSLLKYFRKWHPWYQWMWIAFTIPIGRLIRSGRKT